MASDINRVILIGRLTKDPELKHTSAGMAIASFSVANNKTWRDANGEKKEQVSFFNCVAWGKLGETITQWCKKGMRIGIDGRLQQRTWKDREGNNRSSIEIIVENFQFLESKKQDSAKSEPAKDPMPENDLGSEVKDVPPMTDDNPFSDDDIPF